MTAPNKSKNEIFDKFFYSTQLLSPQEHDLLQQEGDTHEGAVVVMQPGNRGEHGALYYEDGPNFVDAHRDIQIVIVAGVGSSIIGTAALARQVADIYNIKVAGVVSGHGVKDVMQEAIEGYFVYGAVNEAHRISREWTDLIEKINPWLGPLPSLEDLPSMKLPERHSRDVKSLEYILNQELPSLKLLLGHSKGNLTIEAAVERALEDAPEDHRYFCNLNIATFGAVIDTPESLQRVFQFLGSMDVLGRLNSRKRIQHTTVVEAAHHLNPKIPLSFPLERILKQFLNRNALGLVNEDNAPITDQEINRPAAASKGKRKKVVAA